MKQINPESITLAVGDGANDVEMMNNAHIAVGINYFLF
jgi:P-type E1-E2 ATPase